MQLHLLRVGGALGYDVFVAANDRNRTFAGTACFALITHPPGDFFGARHANDYRIIDVLWLKKGATLSLARSKWREHIKLLGNPR